MARHLLTLMEEEMTPLRLPTEGFTVETAGSRDCRYVGDCFTEIVVSRAFHLLHRHLLLLLYRHIIDRENNFNFTYIRGREPKYRFVFVSFGLQTERNFCKLRKTLRYIYREFIASRKSISRTVRRTNYENRSLLIERLVLIFWCDRSELDVMEGGLKGWFDEAV